LSPQPLDRVRKLFHPASSACRQHLLAFCCCFDVRQPFVARVAFALHEAFFLQSGHNPRHRWRSYLFRAREPPECQWASEDDY
jgi:hypothetical protein